MALKINIVTKKGRGVKKSSDWSETHLLNRNSEGKLNQLSPALIHLKDPI